MLTITIPATKDSEFYDENKNEFVEVKGTKEQTLLLEHSLVSLSKWESKWCKPFIDTMAKTGLTDEETIDYIKCMSLTKNVDDRVYNAITNDIVAMITEYIQAPMTATTIQDRRKGRTNKKILTSELIYCYMINLNIPCEFDKWHLNRLMTLIQVCNIETQTPEKMSASETMKYNSALNAARRKRFNSKG